MTDGDKETTFVVFIDSLGADDVEEHTEFIHEHCYDGVMNAGNPYVTPKVLGEIYTGKNPAQHGLPAVSRHNQDARGRPAAITLPEIAAEGDDYENVLQFGLPFIAPPVVDANGKYWSISTAISNQIITPPQAQSMLTIPGPAGDLDDMEEDGPALFDHRVDYIRTQFNTARTLAYEEDFDLVFLSCRILDSYVHYRYNEPEGEVTDRQKLLSAVIDPEVEHLANIGDVFVFGDHGGTEMENVFRINRWLMENDYLDLTIDEEKMQWAFENGLMESPDDPGVVRQVGMAGVDIDEENSVAVCDDPFSTGITLLDGATDEAVDEMIEGLTDTEYIDRVDWTKDMWAGDYLHECPDLYPKRAVGTFVSGNVADGLGGVELTRSGVHHPWGAFGSTKDLDTPAETIPTELFDIILDFLGIEEPAPKDRQYGNPPDDGGDADEREEREVKDRLRDLGYL